jgi:outer membrane protein assembly factor BamB
MAAWMAPKTLVYEDRVIVTAADEPSIHCLSLRDGSLLWKVGQMEDDAYLAGVVAGRVVFVGRQACRALDLSNGRQVWRIKTGLPSGQGTVSGDIYYLPLREAVAEKEPAIYAIDVRKGAIVSRLRPPHREVPGNLLLCQGDVFSQTPTAVSVYTGWEEDEP